MINNILRNLFSYLSAWYPNKKVSLKKDIKLRKYIISKIKEKSLNKNNLQKTHRDFNKKIINLLEDKNLNSFLKLKKT